MSEYNALHKPQSTPARRWSPGRVRLAGYFVGVTLVVGVAALGFWLATAWRSNPAMFTAANNEAAASIPVATGQPAWQRPVVSEDGLADTSGVRIVYVAITGDGGLIDLRFQVVDPDKAVVVHDGSTPPALVVEATGLVVNQLLMGHSHSGDFTEGQTYYLIFENPGNIVQRGSQVSILLGDAEVDHVTVK